MIHIIVRRLILSLPVILLATFFCVALLQLVPGDPATAILGEYATPERLAELRRDLNLDQPLWYQYWQWISNALQGNIGVSLISREPVLEALYRTLPVTLQIVFGSILVSLLGLPIGLFAALRQGKFTDHVLTILSTFGVAIPNFWLAMLLIVVFALGLGLFPATGFVPFNVDPLASIRSTILPMIALGAAGAAETARQFRASMIEVLSSDHARTAKAMGLSNYRRLIYYAARSAALPAITILGLLVNRFLGGTVVVETVFAIPGSGSLAVNAVLQRDFPIVRGVVLAMVLLVLVTNLIVDLLYRVADPRVKA